VTSSLSVHPSSFSPLKMPPVESSEIHSLRSGKVRPLVLNAPESLPALLFLLFIFSAAVFPFLPYMRSNSVQFLRFPSLGSFFLGRDCKRLRDGFPRSTSFNFLMSNGLSSLRPNRYFPFLKRVLFFHVPLPENQHLQSHASHAIFYFLSLTISQMQAFLRGLVPFSFTDAPAIRWSRVPSFLSFFGR